MNRYPRRAFWRIGGVLVVGALLLQAGCASATPPSPTPPPAIPSPQPAVVTFAPPELPGVGTPVAGTNWEYTVTAAEWLPTDALAALALRPLGRYYWIALTAVNRGHQNFGLNAHDFRLGTQGGDWYDPAPDSYDVVQRARRTPLGGQVPPGVALQTGLLFDLAPDAHGLKLQLVQERRLIALPS